MHSKQDKKLHCGEVVLVEDVVHWLGGCDKMMLRIHPTWLPRQRQESSSNGIYEMENAAFNNSEGTSHKLLVEKLRVDYTIQQWPARVDTFEEYVK